MARCQQALTIVYYPHDLRSVGMCNKSEFNTVKIAQFSLFYMAFMVNGHYTKYEQAV